MNAFQQSEAASNEHWEGKHRFEHWYRDNSVYFITARCRDRYPAFASDEAKTIFWSRFEIAIADAGFQPWVTSLLGNHYHTVGYLEHGQRLKRMMQLLHGGTARYVNELLPETCAVLDRFAPQELHGRMPAQREAGAAHVSLRTDSG